MTFLFLLSASAGVVGFLLGAWGGAAERDRLRGNWERANGQIDDLKEENKTLAEGLDEMFRRKTELKSKSDAALEGVGFARQVIAEALDDLAETLAGPQEIPPTAPAGEPAF